VQIRPQKHIRPNNGKVKGGDTKRLAAIEIKKKYHKALRNEIKSNNANSRKADLSANLAKLK